MAASVASLAASRKGCAVATASRSACVASAIDFVVDVGSSNNFCKLLIASATAGSCETGAVFDKASCASSRAACWLLAAVV